MSKLRSVSTAFWSDPFIEDLTPLHKLLFIYLITNDKTNMLGIYEASIKKISNETDIKREVVKEGIDLFIKKEKVKYIDNYVVLVNYMKHQHFNTNMKKSAIDTYNNLPKELKDSDLVVSKDNPLEGFESLSNHYGMVSKYEVEDEEETEDEVKPKKSKGVHLFSNSKYYDKKTFNDAIVNTDFDVKHIDVKYYYDSLVDWSEGGGNKKKDWLATARAWIRRDIKDNSVAIKKPKVVPVKHWNEE